MMVENCDFFSHSTCIRCSCLGVLVRILA